MHGRCLQRSVYGVVVIVDGADDAVYKRVGFVFVSFSFLFFVFNILNEYSSEIRVYFFSPTKFAFNCVLTLNTNLI